MTIEQVRELVNGATRFMPAQFTETEAFDDEPVEAQRFAVVSVHDLGRVELPLPAYWWDGYLPAGVVTLLGAHGGTGKTYIALMAAVCIALGMVLLGVQTRRGKVAFFSGEDGAELLRYRLRGICKALGVDPAELEGRLHVLDATQGDPALFHEVSEAGRRFGATTPTYEALQAYVAQHEIDVAIIDNASDTFDASEIDRARVRGFMRALARIAQARGGAVLLLAHIDKGTARGDRNGSESYSGSTAWHNSARSRLYLSRDKDGALLLEHQKHNLGKLCEPLRLMWPEGGIPQADVPVNGFVQHIADRTALKALLKLISEFTARGEFVSTGTTSRTHAAKLLRHEPGYPKVKDGEVFDMLRRAERGGHLERVEFKGADRHPRERWQVTPSGAALVGIPAATAGTAATSKLTAPTAPAASPAATAATSPLGGVGETAPQEVTAESLP